MCVYKSAQIYLKNTYLLVNAKRDAERFCRNQHSVTDIQHKELFIVTLNQQVT